MGSGPKKMEARLTALIRGSGEKNNEVVNKYLIGYHYKEDKRVKNKQIYWLRGY